MRGEVVVVGAVAGATGWAFCGLAAGDLGAEDGEGDVLPSGCYCTRSQSSAMMGTWNGRGRTLADGILCHLLRRLLVLDGS